MKLLISAIILTLFPLNAYTHDSYPHVDFDGGILIDEGVFSNEFNKRRYKSIGRPIRRMKAGKYRRGRSR